MLFLSNEQIISAFYETLYTLQKTDFYKKLYFLSRIIYALITWQLLINANTGWTVAPWLSNALFYISCPYYHLSLIGFAATYVAVASLIFVTSGLLIKVTVQLYHGNMSGKWLILALRFLLALISTFADPIYTGFLASFGCGWYDPITSSLSINKLPDLVSPNYTSCPFGVSRIVFAAISALILVPFAVCVYFSNLMHVNDPRSTMILSRVHSRIDFLQSAGTFVLVSVATILPSQVWLLIALYMIFQIAVFGCLIFFQPYYQGFTNDSFTGIAGMTVWIGLCCIAHFKSSNKDAAVALAVYVGIWPAFLIGYAVSNTWRKFLVSRGTKKFAGKREIPKVADEDFFPRIRAAYDRNTSTPFYLDIRATLVEVQTRFLLLQQNPSQRDFDIADNILRTGLLKFPQSSYLRLQYLTLLISYQNNVNFATSMMYELSSVSFDHDLKFSLVRKRRELERRRHATQLGNSTVEGGGNVNGLESISFEELKKKIRDARDGHVKAVEFTSQIWALLFRKLGGASHEYKKQSKASTDNQVHPTGPVDWGKISWNSKQALSVDEEAGQRKWRALVSAEEIHNALEALNPLLKQLQKCVMETQLEYQALVQLSPDNREVLLDYARFLRNAMQDSIGADELEEKANQLTAEGREMLARTASGIESVSGGESAGEGGKSDNGSSIAKSTSASSAASSTHTIQKQRQQKMVAKEATRVNSLKRKLRFITLIMSGACAASFGTFYAIQSGVAQDTFFSTNESGLRRSGCVGAAYDLRTMHIAALSGDNTTFASTATSLQANLESSKTIHFNLMFTYASSYQPLLDFMKTQSISVLIPGDSGPFKTVMLSPDELFNKIMDMGQVALSQPMTKFQGFRMWQPSSFPELHFVLANAPSCVRNMDSATCIYPFNEDLQSQIIYSVVVAMCVLVVFVELFAVIAVFRPIVSKMFDEFRTSMFRFSEVPLPVMQSLVTSTKTKLKKIRVIAGDADDQELDPSTALISPTMASIGDMSPHVRTPRKVKGAPGFAKWKHLQVGVAVARSRSSSVGQVSPQNAGNLSPKKVSSPKNKDKNKDSSKTPQIRAPTLIETQPNLSKVPSRISMFGLDSPSYEKKMFAVDEPSIDKKKLFLNNKIQEQKKQLEQQQQQQQQHKQPQLQRPHPIVPHMQKEPEKLSSGLSSPTSRGTSANPSPMARDAMTHILQQKSLEDGLDYLDMELTKEEEERVEKVMMDAMEDVDKEKPPSPELKESASNSEDEAESVLIEHDLEEKKKDKEEAEEGGDHDEHNSLVHGDGDSVMNADELEDDVEATRKYDDDDDLSHSNMDDIDDAMALVSDHDMVSYDGQDSHAAEEKARRPSVENSNVLELADAVRKEAAIKGDEEIDKMVAIVEEKEREKEREIDKMIEEEHDQRSTDDGSEDNMTTTEATQQQKQQQQQQQQQPQKKPVTSILKQPKSQTSPTSATITKTLTTVDPPANSKPSEDDTTKTTPLQLDITEQHGEPHYDPSKRRSSVSPYSPGTGLMMAKKKKKNKKKKFGKRRSVFLVLRTIGHHLWDFFVKVITGKDPHGDDSEHGENKGLTQKTMIVLFYISLMLFIWCCIIAFSAVAVGSLGQLGQSADEMNCSGRRRSLFDFAAFWGRELYYSNNPTMSLLSTKNNATEWLSEASVRCSLQTIAALGQMVHNALMYGKEYGFDELPNARNLGNGEEMLLQSCSVLSLDPELVLSSVHVPGFALKGEFTDFYFSKQCLTTNDFGSNDYATKNPRMATSTQKLSASACVLFNEQVTIASMGMHRFYDEMMIKLYQMSMQPIDSVFIDNYHVVQTVKETTDMSIGLTKALLMVQNSSLVQLDHDIQVMTIFFAVVIVFIFMQYAVLGKRIENLMNGNLSILLIADQLVGEAISKMKKDGFDTKMLEEKDEEEEGGGELAEQPAATTTTTKDNPTVANTNTNKITSEPDKGNIVDAFRHVSPFDEGIV